MRSSPFLAQVLVGRCVLIAWYSASACEYCLSRTSSSARVGTTSPSGGFGISLHNCVRLFAKASCAGARSTASTIAKAANLILRRAIMMASSDQAPPQNSIAELLLSTRRLGTGAVCRNRSCDVKRSSI
jgi:hypothetical protein